MKILMCNKFHFVMGGTERYLFDLSKGLSELGHTVLHFSSKDKRNFYSEYCKFFVESSNFPIRLKFKDIIYIKKAINFIYSIQAKRNITRLIEEYKPDIAHIHNIYHHISSSIIHSLRQKEIPIVMTVHDYKLICPNYSLFTKSKICERCKKHKYYNAILYKCIKDSRLASILACLEMYFCKILKLYEKNIDVFIAPSHFVYNKLVEFGIKEEKIYYLPHAIDLSRFKPNFQPGKYIVYFGNIYYKKGVHLLLQVAKHFKNLHIKIVGDGVYKKELHKFIFQHKLLNIELLGYKPVNELVDIISGALLVIVPSLWYEVAGLTIYEALALGKCVIASNIGGIPEIIIDGFNGILFNPGDMQNLIKKIEYLLNNLHKIKELGENGIETIKKYNNPNLHYQTLLGIYNDIMHK